MPFPRFILAVLAALILGTCAAEAAPAAIAVVLDGSPAMLTKIGNRTKLDIARVAIDFVLKSPAAGQAAGLVAYGHRNKTSCTDVEIAVAPALGTNAAISSATKDLKPVGKASAVAAVKAAAQALDYKTKPANILLIAAAADGCAGDPCMLGNDLEADGNELTVNVVTIGLTLDQGKSLACLATNTGGTFTAATNSDELVAAVTKALRTEQPLPPASVKAPAKIEQGETFSLAWTGPKEDGDRIEIAWPGAKAGTHIRSILLPAEGKNGMMTAPMGRGVYELRYYLASRDRIIARQNFEVVAVTPRIEAPDKVGQGSAFSLVWKGPVGREDVLEISRAGKVFSSAKIRLDTGEANLDAPVEPGEYEIAFRSKSDLSARVTRALTVTAVALTLDVAAAINGGAEFSVDWSGPGANPDEIEIATPNMPDNTRIQGVKIGAPGQRIVLDAPAEGGDFVIRYRSGKSGTVLKKLPVKIAKAKASLDAPAEIIGGSRFEIVWSGPAARNDEIVISLVGAPAGQDISHAAIALENDRVTLGAPLSEGDYEIRYWSARSRAVLASRRIKVKKPNVTMEISGTVSAGKPFAVQWSGPGGRYDDLRVTLLNGKGEEVLRSVLLEGAGKSVTLLAPDKPGTYSLRYWSAQGKAVLASVNLKVE